MGPEWVSGLWLLLSYIFSFLKGPNSSEAKGYGLCSKILGRLSKQVSCKWRWKCLCSVGSIWRSSSQSTMVSSKKYLWVGIHKSPKLFNFREKLTFLNLEDLSSGLKVLAVSCSWVSRTVPRPTKVFIDVSSPTGLGRGNTSLSCSFQVSCFIY